MTRYTIIKKSGYAENVKDGKTYYNILDEIWIAHLQGANHDYPTMLLRDGKIIIDSNLENVACEYGSLVRNLQQKAEVELRTLFPEPEKEIEK